MKKVVLLISFIVSAWCVDAQFQASRLTFGGGIGLQSGDYTVVNIAPQVGYDFTNYFNAGGGLTYTYYKEKYDNIKQTNSYFGLNLYGKLYPIPYIVLMVQPEVNRMWRTYKNTQTGWVEKTEKLVPVCLVGAGVRLGPMSLMLQYDLARDDYSPYGNRIFYSVGYTFNL